MKDPTGYPTGVGDVSYPIESPDFDSEYSWGDGLTPKGLEEAPPNRGGRYHGKAPEPPLKIDVDNDLRM